MKILTFMIIMGMIISIISVSLMFNHVYAGENDPKEFCEDSGGEWNNEEENCEIEFDKYKENILKEK